MRELCRLTALSALLALPLVASADSIDFTFQGEGNTVVFPDLDPIPGMYYPIGNELASVPIHDTVNGVAGFGGLYFFTAGFPVPLFMELSGNCPASLPVSGNSCIVYFEGTFPLLFEDGGFSVPVGTYDLTNRADGAAWTFTVGNEDAPSSPVPEPSTLFLLTSGLAAATLRTVRRSLRRDS
jgi:hypothetical protein